MRLPTTFVLLGLLAGSGAVSAQPAWLVKDINTSQPAPQIVDSTLESEGAGNVAYFVLDDGIHGKEVWRSDGAPGGSRMVRDICPGACSSDPRALTASNGRLFFTADDGAAGRRLWKSDGTPEGTSVVTDLLPGVDNIRDSLLDVGGTLYFAAADADRGSEVWATDGTPEGTRRVTDVSPGPSSSGPRLMAAGNGLILFAAHDGEHGWEPWVTDGTEAGTRMLADIRPGFDPSLLPFNPVVSGADAVAAPWGGFLFVADSGFDFGSGSGQEVWITDGTPEGTRLLKDIAPGSSSPYGLTVLGNLVVFAATGAEGTEPWRTDGTTAGTFLLRDVWPGGFSSSPLELTAAASRVFFRANNGTQGEELWSTDGSQIGTQISRDIAPSIWNAFPLHWGRYGLTSLGGRLVFFAAPQGLTEGLSLWESDGSPAGTHPVAPHIATWPYPDSVELKDGFSVAGGRIFYRGGFDGLEIWMTDATVTGPAKVKAALAPSSAFDLYNGKISFRETFGDLNGTLLFQASNGPSGYELWRSDGTAAGTWQVKDFAAPPFSSYPYSFKAVDGRMVFQTVGGFAASDGTPQGTALLPPQQVIESAKLGDEVFLLAWDVNAPGLWKTDGTAAGTFRTVEIPRDSLGSPAELTASGGKLFFVAQYDGEFLLWTSDGTPAGTFPLETYGFFPSELTDGGGALFFKSGSYDAGMELWMSDGTWEGTVMVKDIRPGSMGSLTFDFVPTIVTFPGGGVLFAANDGESGMELWKSDGTWEGTVRVLDIAPGTAGSAPDRLTVVGNRVYFVADDGVHGRELWVTDGTAAGTRLVEDIVPGAGSSRPDNLAAIGSHLVFSAFAGSHGVEAWRSDGTALGTRRLQDIAPGPNSSSPTEFTPVGDKVYFTASDNVRGFELWAMHRTALLSTFADVAAGHWSWRFVEGLAAAGFTGGCGGDNYCPTSPVTRAEMAVFLERALHGTGFVPPPATGTLFQDIPAGFWAAPWIEQLAADGLTGGCTATQPPRYCPSDVVDRTQIALFLLRAKHGPAYTPPPATGTRFTDVPADFWAAAWIEQLAAEGLTAGCTANQYCPGSPVTREQMAVFLTRTFNLPLRGL